MCVHGCWCAGSLYTDHGIGALTAFGDRRACTPSPLPSLFSLPPPHSFVYKHYCMNPGLPHGSTTIPLEYALYSFMVANRVPQAGVWGGTRT